MGREGCNQVKHSSSLLWGTSTSLSYQSTYPVTSHAAVSSLPQIVPSFSLFSSCLLTLNWQIRTHQEGKFARSGEGKFAHSSKAKLFELYGFNISGKAVGLFCYLLFVVGKCIFFKIFKLNCWQISFLFGMTKLFIITKSITSVLTFLW